MQPLYSTCSPDMSIERNGVQTGEFEMHWLKELLFFHCLDAGYYLARRGLIALSIEITDADIDAFVDIVDEFRP